MNKPTAHATVATLEAMVGLVGHALLANTRLQVVMRHVQIVLLDSIPRQWVQRQTYAKRV